MKACFGIICQVCSIVAAMAGLVPAAILLNPWRDARLASQIDEIYFGSNLARAGVIALAGVIVGYILFRIGVHLKSANRVTPRK